MRTDMICRVCGSVLSSVTFTCVRGEHCRPLATPTEHDKREWSRMAQAAYGSDRNDVGHRFSMASATTPVGGRMELKRYDSLMAEYRAWLVFGEWPSL